MTKLLYVTANPKEVENSFSLQVGEAFLTAYKEANPDVEIEVVDVFKANIPALDGDILSAWEKLGNGGAFNELTEAQQAKLQAFGALTEQFIASDRYVFVTPLWNFTFPAQLKSYLDTVCVAGKTFQYTANGPVGLLENKKLLHIQASGGVYSDGPMKVLDHGTSLIRTVAGFIGISDQETLYVEGMAQAPEQAEAIKEAAIVRATELATTF